MLRKSDKLSIWLILLINAVCIVLIVVLLINYNEDNSAKLLEQNLNDISHLNESSAAIAGSSFDNLRLKLYDIDKYVTENKMSFDEALEYIYKSNTDTKRTYQFIGSDFKGCLTEKGEDGKFIAVDYSNSSYGELQFILSSANTESNEVGFCPEFTDAHSYLKSFALYGYITVTEEDGSEKAYTLLAISKSSDFVNMINIVAGYDNMATVLIDIDGNYILGNSSFKSTNFYRYLYVYNNLSLDEKNKIAQSVTGTDSGNLFYLDSKQENCVYSYSRIGDTGWYSITCVPMSSFHGNDFDFSFTVTTIIILAVMLAVDIGWFLYLNGKLKRSLKKEQEANNAKTDFLSRMSHDIRTPLNGIIGMTKLALEEEGNPPSTVDTLKNIDISGELLLSLINDVLDMNKIDTGKIELRPEPYSYGEFRAYVEAVIIPLCRAKGIDFTARSNADDGTAIIVDRTRLNQIMFNLLSNAVKFTPSGGKVELLCNYHPNGKSKAEMEFTVSDNGIGMSEEFQAHMFEAFTQENRSGSYERGTGTGLGLSIVYKLVRLMNGNITVESHENNGSTFHVSFTADISFERLPDKQINREHIDEFLIGKHILLCEDHPLNSIIAVKLLEKKGVIVSAADNGQSGVEMFGKSEIGYFDAILMDINMPVMNGLDATRAIRRLNRPDAKSIAIIAMTANAYDDDVKKSLDAGMNAHLAKPVNPDVLYEKLCDCIKRE